MSYDIRLRDPKTGETLESSEAHNVTGGTYQVGGTTQCWLNVTYNYSKHFYRVLGDRGIRTIYGMTGEESIPILRLAISQLDDDVSSDYWEATEGNAKQALLGLLSFAESFPEGVWYGD